MLTKRRWQDEGKLTATRAANEVDGPTPGWRDLDDAALLERVLAHDERAWTELVRRYRGLIFRCIMKVTGRYASVLSSEDTAEIFADVCVNLLRDDMHKLRAYDPTRGSKLGSWLGLIAIHTAYDFLRANARHPMLDRLDGAPERESGEPGPEEHAIAHERWGHVGRLLESFTDRDRTFVELYFARGLAPEVVAQAMNISVKTVYSKKNKIRTKLERMARRAAATLAAPIDPPLPLAIAA
jgi:RNA polymerase sigma-70 factor, ECF subfamily